MLNRNFLVLLIFVDISCYYMKQGGLIMTCQRALCTESEEKSETTNETRDEKVPLAPDNGKSTDSAAKDQK